MSSIFDTLVQLPLFKGVGRDTISEVAGKAKFHFLKFPAGETIVNVGDECTHIKFLISGKVRSTIVNSDGRFSVSQTLAAPDVIAPDFLFGRATNYPCRVEAIESTSILQISKNDYIQILNSNTIFLYNFLNTLSMNAQKAVEGILALTNGNIEERIAYWIICLTQRTGSDIVLSCKRRDLYSLFGVQRQSFMAALDHLREMGIVDYTATELHILDRRALASLLTQNAEDPLIQIAK